MATLVPKDCLECREKNGTLPCKGLHAHRVVLFEMRDNTNMSHSCPFQASQREILSWLQPIPAGIDPKAAAALQRLQGYRNNKYLDAVLLPGASDHLGHHRHIYTDERKRPGVFLRKTGNAGVLLGQVSRLFERNLDPEQMELIRNTSKNAVVLPQGTVPQRPVSNTFIPYQKLTLENCGVDFAGVATAISGSSLLGEVSYRGGYHDNVKVFEWLMGGLGRVAHCAQEGLKPDNLSPAIAQQVEKVFPRNQTLGAFVLEILKGLGVMVGMMAGAAAFGAASGAVIGTFIMPGLGTAAGASAGLALATAILNYILAAYDISQKATDVAEHNQTLQLACTRAVEKKTAESIKLFSTVWAAIGIAVALAILALVSKRGWSSWKNRDKFPNGKKFIQDEQRKAGKPLDEPQDTGPGAKKNVPPNSGPPVAPVHLVPKVAIRKLLVARDFGPEVKELKETFEILDDLGSVDNWKLGKGYKHLAGDLPIQDFAKRSKEYKDFIRETLGHIQVVHAGAQMMDAYLAAIPRPITAARAKEYFPSLDEDEARAAASILGKISGNLADAFRRHDVDGAGSKLNIPVARGMSLPNLKIDYMWNDFKKAHPGATPADLKAYLQNNPAELLTWQRSMEVDRSIILHADNFGHHHPQSAQEWVEFGIDVVAAITQYRCYKKGKKPSEFLAVNEGGRGRPESWAESAMLKIGRQLLMDVEQRLGPDFIQRPQEALKHII